MLLADGYTVLVLSLLRASIHCDPLFFSWRDLRRAAVRERERQWGLKSLPHLIFDTSEFVISSSPLMKSTYFGNFGLIEIHCSGSKSNRSSVQWSNVWNSGFPQPYGAGLPKSTSTVKVSHLSFLSSKKNKSTLFLLAAVFT